MFQNSGAKINTPKGGPNATRVVIILCIYTTNAITATLCASLTQKSSPSLHQGEVLGDFGSDG